MRPVGEARLDMNGANGSLRVNLTVRSSTTSTLSTEEKKKASGNGPVSAKGWFSSSMRSKLNFTASALNGVPSWKVTPSRRLNVYSNPSSEMVQSVASAGSISSVPGVLRTSPSYTFTAMRKSLDAVDTCGSSDAGSAI